MTALLDMFRVTHARSGNGQTANAWPFPSSLRRATQATSSRHSAVGHRHMGIWHITVAYDGDTQ